ncbi:SH3 domain-containing protein [Burkholderia dolosa]|nr:SH3 domain-containing protein [Burkholderia dolosa]
MCCHFGPHYFGGDYSGNFLSHRRDGAGDTLTEQLQSFRFVLKEELEVHTHPSSKSPAVGNLALGQVVMLLERQKAWSSVAWTADDESPAVHGWVYSRYVSKIV